MRDRPGPWTPADRQSQPAHARPVHGALTVAIKRSSRGDEIPLKGLCASLFNTSGVGEGDGHDVDRWLGLTAKGGTCVVTAMPKSLLDTDVTLNLAMLTLMQKNLQGNIFGGANPQYDIPLLLSMYTAGKLNLDDMVTREYALDEINDGYQDMLDGKNIRGIIRFSDADR
jgi:Zn-dependent alcohol dehydrogenase